MSRLIFKLETLNPKFRTTFFKHKNYTSYLAYSEYAKRNDKTAHGLFGIVKQFPNIEDMESVEKISNHIAKLAENKVPIYRGVISLNEYDANRLGYLEKDKWKELLENKLPSIARTLNIKYENLQYVGAVHLEERHPHLQFMIWSNSRAKSNYFVKAELKNNLRKEFTNAVFREDLLPLYQQKDLIKKNILAENEILNKLKEINKDNRFIQDIMKYEKNYNNPTIMKQKFKDKELKRIIEMIIDLKKELESTKGSIKYQYLLKYPNIIEKINNISEEIINTSQECKIEIDNYIDIKYKILEFQYSNKELMLKEKQRIKEETEKEVLKMIGNRILDLERKLLNSKEEYTEQQYINETRNHIIDIYGFLCSISQQENCKYKINEINYKKQLSKQAKKEKAKEKQNESSFHWEDDK